MGLRIRQENNDFTLTLKTDGKVVGGLHSRPEYNLSIPDNSSTYIGTINVIVSI